MAAIGPSVVSGLSGKTPHRSCGVFRPGDDRAGQQAGASDVALTKIRIGRCVPDNNFAMPFQRMLVDGPSLFQKQGI